MVDQPYVRCSALDRVMTCSGSLIAPEYPIDYPSLIGSSGTAGHVALSRIIGDGVDPETAIDDAASSDSSLDRSDIAFCVGEALRAWREVAGGSLVPARTEVPLRSRLTRGTADVVVIDEDDAIVLDWKMGYAGDRHEAQLTGYAAGVVELMGRWPKSNRIRTIEVHVRHGTFFERHVTPQKLHDFETELSRRIAHPEKQWAPGRACTYCPSRHACKAREQWSRSAVALLTESMELGPTREMIAELYPRAEALKSALESYWDVLSGAMDDGPLTLPDGRVASWAETRREEIDLASAWSTLRAEGIEAADILGATRISKTALKGVIERTAPRGQKSKRSKAVLDALREAQAVRGNIIQRRDVRRPKE